MSPHMSNDNSVTVASRTPLMMGMSDKYTCGKKAGGAAGPASSWAAQQTPGRKPELRSLPHRRDTTYLFGRWC